MDLVGLAAHVGLAELVRLVGLMELNLDHVVLVALVGLMTCGSHVGLAVLVRLVGLMGLCGACGICGACDTSGPFGISFEFPDIFKIENRDSFYIKLQNSDSLPSS